MCATLKRTHPFPLHSDYFDGSSNPFRDPPGPTGGWFNAIWARDFPLIKKTGANTLRLYNINAMTQKYTLEVFNGDKDNLFEITAAYGKNHVPFLDAAKNAGFMVMYPLLGDENLLMSLSDLKLQQLLMNQIDEVGNHAAILMWNLGNELDLYGRPALRDKINGLMDFAKNYTTQRYNSRDFRTCLSFLLSSFVSNTQ